MHGHAHPDTALLVRARLAQALHLPVVVDAVELEHRELDGLVDVLDLLGLGVGLLLALLAATAETEHLRIFKISMGMMTPTKKGRKKKQQDDGRMDKEGRNDRTVI